MEKIQQSQKSSVINMSASFVPYKDDLQLLKAEKNVMVEINDTKTQVDQQKLKFTIYGIHGVDKSGEFQSYRRYNDFHVFRQALIKRWPGCYVPPIPPRQIFGNLEKPFLEHRKQQLEQFLIQLMKSPTLWYSEESQFFLQSASTKNLDQHYSKLQEQKTEEIINKYNLSFDKLSEKKVNLELQSQLDGFQAFLKHVQPMLANFKSMYENISSATHAQNDQYLSLLTYLLPEYERTCLNEYTTRQKKTLFSDIQSEELKKVTNDLKAFLDKNHISQLLVQITLEQSDVNGFVEVFAQREKYEQAKTDAVSRLNSLKLGVTDVIAGKFTFKSLFIRTSMKDYIASQQLEIETLQKEIEQLEVLCQMITVLLGYVGMVHFKANKEQTYSKMIRQFAEFEIQLAQIKTTYWKFILANKYLEEQK